MRPSYTRDLKSARISNRVNPTTTEVDYVFTLPILEDEPFTLSNQMRSYDGGASFRIDWHLVRGRRTKATDGTTRFEALGTGTLLATIGFIDPGSSLAGLVSGVAVRQFRDAVTGFVKQVSLEKSSETALLQKQIAALRVALGL